MVNTKNNILVCFGWSTLLYLLSIICFGTYFEAYEGLFNGFLSGAYTEGAPFRSWYYMGHIGLSHLYSWLYSIFPSIEWMSWILSVYIILAGTFFLFVMNKTGLKRLKWPWKALLFSMLYLLFFTPNIISLNFTRVAYLLTGTSFLTLLICFNTWSAVQRNKGFFSFVLATFLIGALTRFEPSLAVLATMIPLAIIIKKSVNGVVVSAGFPLFIVMIIGLGFTADMNTTKSYYKQLEPDVELQLMVRENVIPISSMSNAKDSLRYEAVMNNYWSDPSSISVQFMRSLIAEQEGGIINKQQLNRLKIDAVKSLVANRSIIVFSGVLCLLSLVLLFLEKRWKAGGWLVAFLLIFVLFIVTQIYFAKMRPRLLEPHLAIFCIGVLLFLFQTNRIWLLKVGALSIFASVALAWFVPQWINKSSFKQDVLIENNKAYDSIKNKVGEGVLLANSSSLSVVTLLTQVYEPYYNKELEQLYINQAQLLPLIKDYRAYLEKECSCEIYNFSNFYKFLSKDEMDNEVFLLSSQKQMFFTKRYLQEMHGYSIEYRPVLDLDAYKLYNLDQNEKVTLGLYELDLL